MTNATWFFPFSADICLGSSPNKSPSKPRNSYRNKRYAGVRKDTFVGELHMHRLHCLNMFPTLLFLLLWDFPHSTSWRNPKEQWTLLRSTFNWESFLNRSEVNYSSKHLQNSSLAPELLVQKNPGAQELYGKQCISGIFGIGICRIAISLCFK